MSKVSNLNYNNVSVKTDSMVKMIQELSKLGVFKKKKTSKRPSKVADGDSIRQDNEMVGFTKSLGGTQMRNLPPIRQIEAGMTQNQIEDIQRRNNAVVAALRGEVQQQRLEDIEAQQGQRFEDITKLGSIMNPLLERFRGSTFPAQASGAQPIDPFSSQRTGGVIYLGDVPDIQEERFTETLNPGGPEATEEAQTKAISTEEETGIPLTGGGGRIQPTQRIRGAPAVLKRSAAAFSYELPPPPPLRGTNRLEMEAYLRQLTDATSYFLDESVLTSKEKIFAEINRILDEIAKTL